MNVVVSERGNAKFKKSQRIEDSTILDIGFKNDLKLPELYDTRHFKLVAEFIDDTTKKAFKSSISFKVETSDYEISIVHSPQFFKPGIPYTFTLLVARINGYPVLNSTHPVEVEVIDDKKSVLLKKDFVLDPKTGAVEIEVSGVSLSATRLDVHAKYESLNYKGKVYRVKTKQKEFISINVLTPR